MSFEELVTIVVYDYLWGLPLVLLVLFTGIYLTVRSKFFPFRHFVLVMKSTLGSMFGKKKASIRSFFPNIQLMTPLNLMAIPKEI